MTEIAIDATKDKANKFGYLLVVEGDDLGLTGGYLIVSEQGRPLEFHCTETIHPNRAQEILFGATLRPYLIAEQIGGALLKRAQFKADLLIVNDPIAIEAGERHEIKTICLNDDHPVESSAASHQYRTEVQALVDQLGKSIDLNEPFGRVSEAVREACRFHGESHEEHHDEESSGGESYVAA